MKKGSQLGLFDSPDRSRRVSHGGDIRKGRRKAGRPIDCSRPVHLVMRSTLAMAGWSLLHPSNSKRVAAAAREAECRFHVKIYRYVNVGNHLHLLVKARRKPDFQGFLRVFAGRVAMLVTGARKGEPVAAISGSLEDRRRLLGTDQISDGKRFWDKLAFTRIVSWGRDFDRVLNYLEFNLLESLGLIRRKDYRRTPLIFGSVELLGRRV